MATQLIRRRTAAAKARPAAPVFRVNPRQAAIGGAAAIITVYASLFAAIHNARRDESAALRHYGDAHALLVSPPPSVDMLMSERDAARAALAAARAQLVPPDVDLASDDATTMLVRQAEAAGLGVSAIARIAPAQIKEGTQVYDVQGIRMTVTGPRDDVAAYVQAMHAADPGLLPELTAMSIADDGAAQAELTFSAHTKAVPTPAAGARP